VHELTYTKKSSSTNRKWVIKLAAMPPPKPPSKSKRKKTAMERNADLIYYEHSLYGNTLNVMRGNKIPDVPCVGMKDEPPGYGEIDGYRYLVMEKMACPLDALPSLYHGSATSNTPLLGPIASAMLSTLETLHSLHYLFVDVKMDNFMLSSPLPKSITTAKKTSISKEIADSVRLLDFGLLEGYMDGHARCHREDGYPGVSLVGTPLYSSINVLKGHTASRRDDLEGLGYVVLDLLLMSSNPLKKGEESALPWTKGKSDDDILKMKEKSMKKSVYDDLKREEDAVIMKEFFEYIWTVEYSKKPDYKRCHEILGGLVGGAGSGSGAAISSPKKRKKAKPVKKVPIKKRYNKSKKANLIEEFEHETDHEDGHEELEETLPIISRSSRLADPAVPLSGSLSLPKRSTRSNKKKAPPKPVIVDCEENDSKEEEDKLHDVTPSDDDIDQEFHECHPPGKENAKNKLEPMEWSPTITTKSTTATTPTTKSPSQQETEMQIAKKTSLQLTYTEISSSSTQKPFYTPPPPILIHPGDLFTIGRSEINTSSKIPRHVSLTYDETMSSTHLKIEMSEDGKVNSIRITDLKSTNGTFVNGKKVNKGGSRQVFAGDKIEIGNSVFKVDKI